MPNITFTFGSSKADLIFGKCQEPIASYITKRGEAYESGSLIKRLFVTKKSTHFAERYGSATAMEGFKPVGENGPHPSDGFEDSYSKTINNETWKNSFSISREAMDDAQVMNLTEKPDAFISSYYRTRDRFGAAMYGAAMKLSDECTFGTKKFDVLCADGEKLFSKAHPSKLGKKAQSNLFKDALSTASIGAMETAMQNFCGDQQEILDIAPDTILIPNDYKAKNNVFEAIGSDKDPATSNNGYNYQFGRWNIILCPYLNEWLGADSGLWVMLDSKANERYKGAIWQERKALEVRSYINDDNDANVWNGYARFSAGFSEWRFAAIGGVSSGNQLVSA